MIETSYAEWVNNEYLEWGNVLKEYTVKEEFANFKSNRMVQRMVGVSDMSGVFLPSNKNLPWQEIQDLDKIGNPPQVEIIYNKYKISTITLRYVYYAEKILDLIKNLDSIRIVEIGGGYGGFCSILNCLAKDQGITVDEYGIYDLQPVQKFQKYYLEKTLDQSIYGIRNLNFLDSSDLDSFNGKYTYFISFYALGEFDPPVKYDYINKVISKIKNGFILWNPHRSKDEIGEKLLLSYHPNAMVKKEDPLTSDHNLEIII
jgi:putative sugar O-methyltransferase